MEQQLIPYEAAPEPFDQPDSHHLPDPPSPPQWGLFIVTGLVAALLVILGGLLLKQVADALQIETPPPLPTTIERLPPSLTPQLTAQPVLALQIPHEGYWTWRLWIQTAQGDFFYRTQSGTGKINPLTPPPSGSRFYLELDLRVEVLQPNLTTGQPLPRIYARFSHYPDYLAALNTTYYAFYDSQKQWLETKAAADFAPTGVRIEVWSP